MEREIRITADGSHTLFIPGLNEPYHSVNGAITESMHVFIRNGLDRFTRAKVRILEFGFGTGLNAFLTLLEAGKKELTVSYTSIEKYPITVAEQAILNYPEQLGGTNRDVFMALHEAPWEEDVRISGSFTLHKIKGDFTAIELFPACDLVYFDAFAPEIQPELWSEDLFKKVAYAMEPAGILVTYSAKGSVKRALQAVGLKVSKHPGPPGKREIISALKSGI